MNRGAQVWCGAFQPGCDAGPFEKKHRKRRPPQQIVEHDQRKCAQRQLAVPDRHHPADRSENFSGESDRDEDETAVESPRRVRVSDAVQPDHHAEARPDAGVFGLMELEQREKRAWKQRGPQTEKDVVRRRSSEDQPVDARRIRAQSAR